MLEKHTPIKTTGDWVVTPSLGLHPVGGDDSLIPFTLTDLSGGAVNDPYNGQLIRGICNNTATVSNATLKPIFESLDFDWTQHKTGYLDMITYNFMWDPTEVMPTPGKEVTNLYSIRPNYLYLYIVKIKDPYINYVNNVRFNGAGNLNVTDSEHFLTADGSIDSSKLQQDVHYSIGVNKSNVILSDRFFDVKAKWNLSYNMKSIASLNLPGNAVCSWRYQLPGGHRKLHRQQPWMGAKSGNVDLDATGQSEVEVNNPNLTGASTGSNNLSWIVYEPKHCDWKDQYHVIGFTSQRTHDEHGALIPNGQLHCRLDYTFSTM